MNSSEPTKTILNDSSYYLEYQEELDLSNSLITVFGYVSFNEDDSQIDSVENQIKAIINYCDTKLFRIYVSINDNDTFKKMQDYIDPLISYKTHNKISIVTTDVARLLNLNIYNILEWFSKKIYLEFIYQSFNIRTNEGKLLFNTFFRTLEYQKTLLQEKKDFLCL